MESIERITESIKEYVKQYKLKKKASLAYNTDLDATQLSKYLLKRVEQCISESIEVSGDIFVNADKASRYLRIMILTAFVDKTQSNNIIMSQPYLRINESLNLLNDALLLAMAGRYTSSLTTLRSALESILIGGFYHGLFLEKRRNNASDFLNKKQRYPWTLKELVESIFAENPEISEFLFEAHIESRLLENKPPLSLPSLSYMLKVLIKMYDFSIFQDPYKEIHGELYENLSVYAHVMREATTFWQHIPSDTHEFDSGKVSKEMMTQFGGYFINTLDIIGALFFIFSSECYSSSEVRQAIITFDSKEYENRKVLHYTTEAMYSAIGLARKISS
jgi:hypothetical protein